MDFDLYLPCQPGWICQPFAYLFALLAMIGLGFFIRIIYREYQKIQRAQKVRRLRRIHYRDRNGGKDGRPTNIK
ncbi:MULTISPECIES: hypothetical protein [Vibrio]|uniref:Uncharacterized protein n=1 Tax=Vibrio anguillarum TaxID=55601 RepID=A0AAW4B6H7_VIBAN|nr:MULTISPECIES: hypothetical protein [Vibrio]AQP35983.1 hypothetical protein AA909_06365 [Vibrio anguillarum]MBF4433119.1 hypothetical protein [Vibrio anguillarum]MDF9387907.1 hypothetical protein [Vibrio sp. 1151_11]NAW91430.1 hypothetical protein [Vibrio sp. V24_P1S3T111]NNN47883.1 hypothetical protein [Vibrio sp. 2-2(8)]